MRLKTLLGSLILAKLSYCVKFTIPASTYGTKSTRCLGMTIPPSTIVAGMVECKTPKSDLVILNTAYVEDSEKNIHWKKSGIENDIRFTFRTHDKTLKYKLCVKSELPLGTPMSSGTPVTDVAIEMHQDYDYFDYDIAEKLKIAPLEKSITELEGSVKQIMSKMSTLYDVERQMREVNESTNTRVRCLGAVAIFVFLFTGLWMIHHLKQAFQKTRIL